MTGRKIYILDDDSSFAKLLAARLERAGEEAYRVAVFDQPQRLLEKQEASPADAILSDLLMPGMNGIELTRTLRRREPTLPVFVLTAHGEMDTAIKALQAGANEYLTKPVNLEELTTLLDRALEERPMRDEVASLEATRRSAFSDGAILGDHPKIQEVREFEQRVASVPGPTVLLFGESGTGKNLVARTIHYASPHSSGRFVEINCSALPSQLLEAELFGYQKGAFTDARESKRGLIEIANEGTLFLDEIGDLSPELQAKLLNFIESRQLRRVGGTEEIDVSLRVITATNRDLPAMIREKTFRSDLYYRLSVATHTLPPLREVRSDIPQLADHFREMFAREFRKDIQSVNPDALEVLMSWRWPGNVRELRNVIERAMIFADGHELRADDLPALMAIDTFAREPGGPFGIREGLTLAEVEREYILGTLRLCDENVQQAADVLGISRKSLWEKRKKHGLLMSDASTA